MPHGSVKEPLSQINCTNAVPFAPPGASRVATMKKEMEDVTLHELH